MFLDFDDKRFLDISIPTESVLEASELWIPPYSKYTVVVQCLV